MLKISVLRGHEESEKRVIVKLRHNGENLAKMSDVTIDTWIQEGIDFLHENEDDHHWYLQSGDTLVLITRDNTETSEGYEVIIATPRQYAYARLEN